MKIICEMKKCVYNVDKGENEGAYQFQCGADEVEIGENPEGKSECYTLEEKK